MNEILINLVFQSLVAWFAIRQIKADAARIFVHPTKSVSATFYEEDSALFFARGIERQVVLKTRFKVPWGIRALSP